MIFISAGLQGLGRLFFLLAGCHSHLSAFFADFVAVSAFFTQGVFPFRNTSEDGFLRTAPVGCFDADALGLVDILGNVWEWTSTPYYPTQRPSAGMRAQFPNGFNQDNPQLGTRVIKGGSFLCAPNFCARYTPSARQPQEADLGTSHIGFRTVLMAPGP